jgi:hypothetical protein
MIELGYSLSSEEFAPDQLVGFARQAEKAGFKFSLISDHYHPWTNQQPHSAFVWSTIGGISQVVENLWLGTGVTCPTIRINPAIVAQAAATSAVLMRGQIFPGCRYRRKPKRTHLRRSLAEGERTAGEARRGNRGNPPAVARWMAEPPRETL